MVLARPARPANTIVDGVFIKPPFTLSIKMPKLPNVPSGYDGIDYTIYIDYCHPDSYDATKGVCGSYLNALSVVKHLTGSVFDVRLGVREYYTGAGLVIGVIASNFALGVEHTTNLYVSGCNVSLAVDGKTYLATNMFKEAKPLTRINFEVVAYSGGSVVNAPSAFIDPAWVIDVVQQADIGSILNIVIPIAIGVAILGAVLTAITRLGR